MNANGSGERAVASTRAADFKPIWSPNSKDLLIVSNRKSDFGGPGRPSTCGWYARVMERCRDNSASMRSRSRGPSGLCVSDGAHRLHRLSVSERDFPAPGISRDQSKINPDPRLLAPCHGRRAVITKPFAALHDEFP